jgi:transcriptional regulator with GAF, ATPase, and Fis domain
MKKGDFELANNGTLFLDEIGDMSLSAQAKVLRALQENKITRVGGESEINVNVRIIQRDKLNPISKI